MCLSVMQKMEAEGEEGNITGKKLCLKLTGEPKCVMCCNAPVHIKISQQVLQTCGVGAREKTSCDKQRRVGVQTHSSLAECSKQQNPELPQKSLLKKFNQKLFFKITLNVFAEFFYCHN